MKKFLLSAAAALMSVPLLLQACDKTHPIETVESLLADPERLKLLREQCKAERAKVGKELCDRAAIASNRQFFGDGKAPRPIPE